MPIIHNPEKDKYGGLFWRNEKDEFHREDGPAIITSRGDCYWFKNGKLHREGGPAIERANGDKEWWVDGKRHRSDGPAIECTNGYKEWWVNGKLHRENGPEIEWANGDKEWRQDTNPLDLVQYTNCDLCIVPSGLVDKRNVCKTGV